MFKTSALSKGSGEVVVVNYSSLTARQFYVSAMEDREDPNRTVLVAREVSLDPAVSNVMNELATISSNFNSISSSNEIQKTKPDSQLEAFGVTSQSSFNGCGSPQQWTYSAIPDFPFEEACNAHDVCYGGTRSKESCDDEFLFRMLDVVETITPEFGTVWSTILAQKMLKGLFAYQAVLYHNAVKYGGHDIYCNATQSNSVECNDEVDLDSGAYVGSENVDINYPAPNNGTIYGSCEIWQFPDGNGGHYYLERNCNYWMMTP